ncbi:MAG: helix-hairpin-helix domain-containing protein [Bacteroidota bacterium]
MIKFLLILFLLFFSFRSFSQGTKLSEVVISIAEELAADDSDPEAASSYVERLYELAENPVKLNSAGENEISRLFFLSDFQVKVIIDYIHSSGRIVSVYELANVPGFDRETVEMMIPFILLDSKVAMTSDSVRWRNASITNLSIRSGNGDTTSSGSRLKMLTKYKFTAGSFSGGLTVEKDPGEKLFAVNSPLPDFLSAHIVYNGTGLIQRLIVGDYSARFGQGTNINTGIRTGLSLTAPGYMSARDEIKPYTSTDENNFFRGVAAEFSHKNIGLSLFYSKNYLDATLGSTSDSSSSYIENFYLAGVHNTPSTLLKKDAISELAYGINLSYNFNNVRMGFTWSGNRFSLPVRMAGNDPEDIFKFDGNGTNLYTISYSSLIKRILLYGEFSTNGTGKYAFVQGLSFRPSDRLTINFLFRNYNGGFISFHGKGPGSGTSTGNENGILGNFSFEAARHLFISGGCDIQHFLWLKYRCSAPTWGMKQEIRARFLPTEKLTFDASYNYRYSMVDNIETSGIPKQKEVITKSFKWSVRYALYDNLTLGTRIDYKTADPTDSRGALLLQEINYRFRQLPVTVWLRYCLFSTDTWDSRLYTYENDLLYSFSIPALSGEGSRSYIMVKWEISDIAELRVKYGITTSIENGASIKDNEELKIQIKIQF